MEQEHLEPLQDNMLDNSQNIDSLHQANASQTNIKKTFFKTPRTSHHIKFLFFTVTIFLFIGIVLFVENKYNSEENNVTTVTSPLNTANDAQPSSTASSSKSSVLKGFISGYLTGGDSMEKWIEVSVTENSVMNMPKVNEDNQVNAYLFYLNSTLGKDIVGGERVTVTFYGEPSKTEYISVDEIVFEEKKE